ncbi:MAG: response regulator [Methanomassiliicoccales archaeon]|jgi:CheY-like chemotaxis protein|nr:response regulator [Methanomassiliicoccales archaeon]
MGGIHRVLVAEDDEAVLEIMKLMLSSHYEVKTAPNGKIAIDVYIDWKPDVVLMDILMPILDGISATRTILKMDPKAKIIGVTAYATQRGKEMLEAGALEVITKPFSSKYLIERIKNHLADDEREG